MPLIQWIMQNLPQTSQVDGSVDMVSISDMVVQGRTTIVHVGGNYHGTANAKVKAKNSGVGCSTKQPNKRVSSQPGTTYKPGGQGATPNKTGNPPKPYKSDQGPTKCP